MGRGKKQKYVSSSKSMLSKSIDKNTEVKVDRMFRCKSITPFGTPVEPLVYMMMAGSFSCGGTGSYSGSLETFFPPWTTASSPRFVYRVTKGKPWRKQAWAVNIHSARVSANIQIFIPLERPIDLSPRPT